MIGEIASNPYAHQQQGIIPQLQQIRVAEVSAQFVSVNSAAISLLPPLDQFQVEPGAHDITVKVEWLPDLPMDPARQLFDSGYTWRLYQAGSSGFRFDFFAPAFGRLPFKRLLIDTSFSEASLQRS